MSVNLRVQHRRDAANPQSLWIGTCQRGSADRKRDKPAQLCAGSRLTNMVGFYQGAAPRLPARRRTGPAEPYRRAAGGATTLGVSGASTMDSQTKHDFLVIAAAALVVGVVTTITFAILLTQLN
jgi:hypothetical protein